MHNELIDSQCGHNIWLKLKKYQSTFTVFSVSNNARLNNALLCKTSNEYNQKVMYD